MSALDFVSPGAARDSGGFHPLARGSMERRYRDAGATFVERDGWLVAVSVPGEDAHLAAVGITDLSHLTKLEVQPSGSPSDLVTDRYKVWYDISPRRALVLCEASHVAALREQLEGRVVLDVTAQHGIMALVGPEAAALLRRLTHLHDLPAGGEVAHITAHVLPQDGGYWIVFPQEYGHYLYEVAVDRARVLGGGPAGVDAVAGRTA